MSEFFPGHRHKDATEVAADIRDRLVREDQGEPILEDFRLRAKANAWQAAPRTIQTSAEFLMRNLVVAQHNLGRKRTIEAIGTTYGEIIQMAWIVAGQRSTQHIPETTPTMEALQAGFNNHQYEITDAADAGDRAQLIDGLMFANQQLLIGPERETMVGQTDLNYYLNNIAAAYMNLERQH
jgi:hypothetical protein